MRNITKRDEREKIEGEKKITGDGRKNLSWFIESSNRSDSDMQDLRSEKERENIDIYRQFIEKICHFRTVGKPFIYYMGIPGWAVLKEATKQGGVWKCEPCANNSHSKFMYDNIVHILPSILKNLAKKNKRTWKQ